MRLEIHCPYCKRAVPASPLSLGKLISCPVCRNEFMLQPSAMQAPSSDRPTSRQPATAASRSIETRSQPAIALAPSVPHRSRPVADVPRYEPEQLSDQQLKVPQESELIAGEGLQELQLTDALNGALATHGSRTVSACRVGIALALSVLVTSALLFADFGGNQPGRDAHDRAMQQVVRFYGDERGTLQPYQLHLRAAQLAHSANDLEAERTHYRQVLKILRAEGRNPFQGITGTPKDDAELEQLIIVLLNRK